MKRKAYRFYVNYKKEEEWLNRLEQRGLHFVDFSFPGRYLFEEGRPGEYIYRLELLPSLPSNPESAAYIRFMEESGVECVCTYLRWAYFRKKASEGAFEIYTDLEGKLKHAWRVLALLLPLFALNLGVAAQNLGIGLHYTAGGWPGFNAYFSVLNGAVAGVLLTVIVAQGRLIHSLKKDSKIRE